MTANEVKLAEELAASKARVVELEAANARVGANRVDHYRVPKIPSFFRADPDLWFVQVEVSLRNARITDQATKADSILAGLDVEVLGCVKDIITADPLPDDIYDRVKSRIIATFSISEEAKLRKLLKGQVLSDGKPSLVLSRLRNLNEGNHNDAIVRSVFLDQLPPTHRAILMATGGQDLDGLAEAADRLSDCSGSSDAFISAVNKSASSSTSSDKDLARVFSELASLSKKVSKLEKASKKPRDRSTSSPRSRSRPRSTDAGSLCFAHSRYPQNPTSCKSWCSEFKAWSEAKN